MGVFGNTLRLIAAGALTLASCTSTQNVPAAPTAGASSGGLQFTLLTAPASVFPSAAGSAPTGIVGNFITNTVFFSDGSSAGALYNLATRSWTPIRVPSASSTAAYGPAITSAGYRIVGSYKNPGAPNDHGFILDSGTGALTTIDPPAGFCAPSSCNETIAHSTFGDAAFKVVGNTDAIGGSSPGFGIYPATSHAFLYDSASAAFTLIDFPASVSTTAYGIWLDGTEVAVAGGFTDLRGTHAYVRGLTSGTTLVYDYPGAGVTHFEGITGAGGPGNYNVAGDFATSLSQAQSSTGFFLPIRNWQAGTPVTVANGSANSVFQTIVVGVSTGNGPPTGFIATLPSQ